MLQCEISGRLAEGRAAVNGYGPVRRDLRAFFVFFQDMGI